jgi:eukaryotic-like serine/threonine-protein kinase
VQVKDLNAEQFGRLSDLLDQAFELVPERRTAWLAELATHDPELCGLVTDLIASDSAASAEQLIETREVFNRQFAAAIRTQHSLLGKQFGPYRVVRQLGQGGMGSVWLADRIDGLFTRQVALKLVHLSFAGTTLLERFAREREILAALNHPRIGRLLDAGISEDGQPYLALEYIEGTPLTAYCDEQRLPVKTRVELIVQVLSAVQHAHRNLVVHRDLKPSNILVTTDGDVRLLDFGIAKLLSDGVAQESALTELSGRALTPEYASPEQIAGQQITIASDVYSLGVVLYELLCGNRPYRLKRDSRGALEEAILNADSLKPSQAAITDEIAEARSSSAKKLRQMLTGDLDTIVGKALKKEAGERYVTADAFAQDLQRYLDGEPVLARPDSAAYRIGKFVARNRLAVAAAVLVGVALASATGVSLWQARIAREQASVAKRESSRAQAVQEFLLDIFRTNSDSQPDPIKARQTTARELLDIGAKRVGERLKDAPEAQAEVSDTLADMYSQVGLDNEAADMLMQQTVALNKAYGPRDPRVVDALLGYAGTISSTNKRAEPLPALNEARAILDATHDDTSVTRGILLAESARYQMYESVAQMRGDADEAVRFFREHHPEHGRLIGVLRLAGRARFWLGDYEGSEAAYLEALDKERARDAQDLGTVITLLVELADTQLKLVKIADAERNLRLALAETGKRNGDLHVDTLQVETRLGAFLHATSRRVEGRQWLESAANKLGRAPGTDSVNVISPVRRNYAAGLMADGRIDEARPSIVSDAEYLRQHYTRGAAMGNGIRAEGAMYVAIGHYDEAARRFGEAWDVWIATTQGAAEPVGSNPYLIEQARLFLAQGDATAAVEQLGKVASPKNAANLPLRVDENIARILLSQAALQQDRIADAQNNARQALESIVSSPAREYFQSLEADAALRLGEAQQRAGDARSARSNLERAVKLREGNDDVAHSPWLAEAQVALADCLIDLGQRDGARRLIAKAATIVATHKELGEQFKAPLRRVAGRLTAR